MSTVLQLITFPRVLCVILGLVLGEVIRCLANVYRKKTGKQPKSSTFHTVVGVIVIISALWVMVATAQGRNCALTVNLSVAEAQRIDAIDNESFQTVLKESLPYQNLPEAERRAATKPFLDKYLATQGQVVQLREANRANQAAAQKACGVK